ncbi:MAG TPA: MBL fold metallo-hydrolase [Phycisphaerales bacterium]|nr:MBL fold metallo-hydrolase [Phycisphaerales bacterium]
MAASLSFYGAAENVTGSCFLLQVDGIKILIDCGLYQERDLRDRNWDEFPVPANEIDAVLITHAHIDHCGRLPKLVKEGFSGKIYCTHATKEIAGIVLLDCGHLQEEDAEYKRKRHKKQGRVPDRPVEALYNVEDAEKTLPHFSSVDYKQPIVIANNFEVTFHDAGHILGSSIIKIKVPIDGQSRTLLFTGDVGRAGRPILQDPSIFDEADYILLESTYGDRTHDTFEDTKEKLTEAINNAFEAGGNILVPSFAIERSQEIMYFLNELIMEDKIPPIMAFLDSPMAVRVTDVFRKHPELFDKETKALLKHGDSPFDTPCMQMVRTTRESKAINKIRGTIMVIAGSGMCTGGRIKHHLAAHISNPETTVLFVGYQAVGTLGRQIIEGEKEVRILGQNHHVAAKIVKVLGFSAHADKDELFNWLGNFKNPPRHLFVVHGETKAAHSFAEYVKEKKQWNATVPQYQQEIAID